ncbi:hypothetical protein ACIRP0_14915 [Streptomyces sp. NPDC101733]|uniref:hypothetical protein n=1 Tax=unclassified Streptomyces TaxID=2593676 RepID=UPI00380FB18A
MLVHVEAVRQDPATPATVRVRSAVGTVVVFWQGAPDAVGGEHHVEWTVDEDIVWSLNAGPAASARSILFDVAGPPPPDGADGAWIQVRVGRGDVSVWPHQL